jgi:uncharacterized membrane protein YozB (DUF420 family)
MELRDLPTLNALLNTTCAVLLCWGYFFIRRGDIQAHRRMMTAAFATSVLFLASYLVYHFNVGSVKFAKTGPVRTIYFTVLISHTVLAIFVAPMAIITIYRAWKGKFERHRKLARITLPLWLYVSVTGVMVYVMLYQM